MTPSREEVAAHLRRLLRRIRRNWPATRITIRGDSHYGRPEVMNFCEKNVINFVFGLAGNAALDRGVEAATDDSRTRRALTQAPVLRGYAETMYQAKSWAKARRVCARIEATTLGLDIRFVVTSLATGSAEHIYDILYCARGQAEPDQDAQASARLRPNQLSFAARQSDAADPAYCRLLAYADRT
jgi:hypothetical protein